MSSVLKFAMILLAAAVLAFGARALYVNSLNRHTAPVPDAQVRVAAADLPTGLLLRDSDLAWQPMPRGKVPADALVEHTPDAAIAGSLLRHGVKAGTILKGTDMIRPDAPGFLAAALKPSMRAVSVPINDVSGNAGLIQPGDFVDMILTQRMGGRGAAGKARVASETVVENARVIAVGSSFQRESDASKPSRARTVTIEVSPRAAEAVTVAAELGSLSMALRSFATNDRDAADRKGDAPEGATVVAWEGRKFADPAGPVWGSDVSRALDDVQDVTVPVGARPPEPRRITILRGANKQEQELVTHAQ